MTINNETTRSKARATHTINTHVNSMSRSPDAGLGDLFWITLTVDDERRTIVDVFVTLSEDVVLAVLVFLSCPIAVWFRMVYDGLIVL